MMGLRASASVEITSRTAKADKAIRNFGMARTPWGHNARARLPDWNFAGATTLTPPIKIEVIHVPASNYSSGRTSCRWRLRLFALWRGWWQRHRGHRADHHSHSLAGGRARARLIEDQAC